MYEIFKNDPVVLLFLVLAIGFLIGNIKVGSFQLGSVAGVLLAGLALGHFGFESNPSIQSFGFVLFIFSVGYQAGPKFIQAMKKDGRRYLAIALIVALSGFGLAYGISHFIGFEEGISAGALSGALTSTPTLAAADSSVLSADYVVPDGLSVEKIRSNITTAYAITYVFGLVGLILIIRLLPRILGIDLVEEAKKLESEEGKGAKRPQFSPTDIVVHAFRVESDEIVGIPLEQLYETSPVQFTVQKLRRDGELIVPTPAMVLQKGDVVSVVGVLDDVAVERLSSRVLVGTPVPDRELLHFNPETAKICVSKKGATGTTLGELKIPENHASFVSKMTRMGVDIDISPTTKLERGDVLEITGPGAGLDNIGEKLGHVERDVAQTDLSTFSWAIVIGTLLGTLTVTIAGIKIGLGSAGGLLTLGLLVGYLRSLFPVFGRVPSGAQWIFTELGLLIFMAGVGLRGGDGLLETLKSTGLPLMLTGIVITTVPLALAYLYGRKVLKMNPLMLLGTIVGAMTSGGALSVINDQSKSAVASIGYTGSYAFANILLTLAGALIILL
jgi:putative transport protein